MPGVEDRVDLREGLGGNLKLSSMENRHLHEDVCLQPLLQPAPRSGMKKCRTRGLLLADHSTLESVRNANSHKLFCHGLDLGYPGHDL